MTAYAVEVDQSTEPIKTLRDKALAYRRIREDPTWFQRFGKLPLPLWVAPDRERLKAIHAAWVAAWPAGRWYLTTDADLPTLAALAWRDGALGRATLAGTSASGGPQPGTSRSTAP
jgi:hypothetical protein